jgi:hypothetical protein
MRGPLRRKGTERQQGNATQRRNFRTRALKSAFALGDVRAKSRTRRPHRDLFNVVVSHVIYQYGRCKKIRCQEVVLALIKTLLELKHLEVLDAGSIKESGIRERE